MMICLRADPEYFPRVGIPDENKLLAPKHIYHDINHNPLSPVKKIIVAMALILLSWASGAQTSAMQEPQNTKARKTWANLLTFGGCALIVGGLISYDAESYTSYYPGKTVGTLLMVGGASAVAGGIVLFSEPRTKSNPASRRVGTLSLQMATVPDVRRRKDAFPILAFRVRF